MSPELLFLILLSLLAVGFIISTVHLYVGSSIYKRIREKHPDTWRKFDSPDLSLRISQFFSLRNNRINHYKNFAKLVEYLLSNKDAPWAHDKELLRKVSQIQTMRRAFNVLFVIFVTGMLITLYLTSL